MAVKIRLKRMGKKRQPSYRVVVAEARSPRDGRFIEQIGRYDPLQHPSIVEIDNDRALDWLGKGAQPTDAVRKLLQISGAWGTFRATKGEADTVGELAPPPTRQKRSKKEKARAAAVAEPAEATSEEGEAAPEAAAAEEPAAEAPAAEEEPAAEAPAAEEPAPEPESDEEPKPEEG
ncbi:MAG: 30S ribosomal protein S16 [Acidimicrobiia bacterium]|nr:30S ribosomal protein S16 [Acidimicrobiia bacterium]